MRICTEITKAVWVPKVMKDSSNWNNWEVILHAATAACAESSDSLLQVHSDHNLPWAHHFWDLKKLLKLLWKPPLHMELYSCQGEPLRKASYMPFEHHPLCTLSPTPISDQSLSCSGCFWWSLRAVEAPLESLNPFCWSCFFPFMDPFCSLCPDLHMSPHQLHHLFPCRCRLSAACCFPPLSSYELEINVSTWGLGYNRFATERNLRAHCLSPASMAAFPIRKHLAASSLLLSIFPASLKILLPPVVFQSITKGMAFLPNSAPKQQAKNKERAREREQPTEPTCEIWFSFALSDAEDVNRRTEEEDEGRAAHKGKGFRHRQGQRREGRETPGARSPIGKATEQNGELPLFCYCFWSLFVGPRRRILKVVAEKQLFKKNSFLLRNLKMLCFLIWKRKSILRRITKCHNLCHAFWHWWSQLLLWGAKSLQFWSQSICLHDSETCFSRSTQFSSGCPIQSVRCPWCVVVVANFLFTARVWCVGRAGMGKCQRYVHHLFLLKTSLNCNWEWLGTHALCIKDLKDSSQ